MEDNINQIPKIRKEGIGGWLLLFVIFLCGFLIYSIPTITPSIALLFEVINNASFFENLLFIYNLFIFVLNILLAILSLVQIIRKNKAGTYTSILFLSFTLYKSAIMLISSPGSDIVEFITNAIFLIIWIIYFIRSTRVTNTLVNQSENRWIPAVNSIGNGLLAIGYLGGFIFHIYTVILLHKIYGIGGLLLSFFLPVISEIFMFIYSISTAGSFYTIYNVIAVFYLLTTFGLAWIIAFVEDCY